jgi:hypothetical protein
MGGKRTVNTPIPSATPSNNAIPFFREIKAKPSTPAPNNLQSKIGHQDSTIICPCL